jgi:hypothetical protein
MCLICDNPTATVQDYLEHTLDLIRRHGWTVLTVSGDRLHAPLAYTVGLTGYGKPELVVTGMRQVPATRCLNVVAGHLLHSQPPAPGGRLPVQVGPAEEVRACEVVELPNPDAHLFTATALFGPHVQALQLVWPDDRGRYPWERGHRAGRGGQPVLGPRAT